MAQVSLEEGIDLYRQALHRDLVVSLADPNVRWDQEGVYGDDVEFRFGDWLVTLTNFNGDVEWTRSITSPDGRTAGYGEWELPEAMACIGADPFYLLTLEEQFAFRQLLAGSK
jgi:hypothetical protein